MARLLTLLSLIALPSCAFGDSTASLYYPPQEVVEQSTDEADAPAVDAASLVSRPAVFVGTIEDTRIDKRMVGELRNGWGMHTADVLTDDDGGQWVQGALRHEFAARGYEVVADPKAGALQVTGELQRTESQANFSYEGEVTVAVRVTRDGTEVLGRRFVGKGDGGVNWAARGVSFSEALALSLHDALRQLFEELERTAPGGGQP